MYFEKLFRSSIRIVNCKFRRKTFYLFYDSNDENVSREPPGAPPNTRAPSPQPQAAGGETRLPYADPVPVECKEMALPWIEVCIRLDKIH